MPLGFDATASDLVLVLKEAAEQPGVPSDGLPRLDHEGDAAVSVAPSGERSYEVKVTVDPRSDWPAVRAYQALMELAPLGTVVRSTPSEQDLQSGEGGQTLLVTMTSARDAAVLREAVATVSEIVGVEARLLTTATDRSRELREKPGAAPLAYSSDERRRIDLGRELRGASAEEQLAIAGERLARLSRMVKLDSGRLDELMNLAGELVIHRRRLARVMRELDQRHCAGVSLEHLAGVSQQLARLSDAMQDRVMRFRLLPVEGVFNRSPRMARDLASTRGKAIRFETRGDAAGIDRALGDELFDVLGLLVDGLVGEQAGAITSNATPLGDAESTAGAAILADGSVWLIVDVPRVVETLSARLQGALVQAG